MLPGFRFLFAAIMLSMSLLVFGLGAAALLRAAHESFASNSSWRAAPEVSFAQRTEPALPVLATLRVDTLVIEKAPEQAPPTASSADTSPATPATMPAPAAPEQVAALNPTDVAQPETPKSEATSPGDASPAMLPAENPPPAATPPASVTATAGDQTAVASTTPAAPSPASEPVTALPEPASASRQTQPADQTSTAVTRIATLGGPPVDIIEDTRPAKDKTAKPDQTKTDADTIKRRVQARRAAQRRRLAAIRARLAAQQQVQVNPFGQQPPFPTPAATSPHP
jgi:hypothetical protein